MSLKRPEPDTLDDGTTQPGAHRVPGANSTEDDEEQTLFTLWPAASNAVSNENPAGQASSSSSNLVVEAELVQPSAEVDLEAIEEEIRVRIMHEAPVAQVAAGPQTQQETPPSQETLMEKHKNKESPKKRKRWIFVGVGALIVVAAGLGVGLGLGLSSDETPSVNTRADSCFVSADNSIVCSQEETPASFLLTLFGNCPSNPGENVFECETCQIYFTTSGQNIDGNTPTCRSCMVCHDSVAFDCTNLRPQDECAFRDCDGGCGKGPLATPNPQTQADDCTRETDGSISCFKTSTPESFLTTNFQDCPTTSGTNVYECDTCSVQFNNVACNACLVCGDSVSYDCTNLKPDDSCARKTCDGSCVG